MKRYSLAFLCLVAVVLACAVPVGTPVPAARRSSTSTATRLIAATRTPRPAATRQAFVTATRSLNVRERAGNDQPVIGALYSGNSVTLTGRCKAGWAEIEWENDTAWVNAKYLSDNKCKE